MNVTSTYTQEQTETIRRYEQDLAAQLASKPKRLKHSLSVARCAEELAAIYGVDPYPARVAGILHDWEKATPEEELVTYVRENGPDLGIDPARIPGLLHGYVAAFRLHERYPELTNDILHAIAVHTTADFVMSDLDMLIFVADGIEPLRGPAPGIEAVRAKVGRVSLCELFWFSFVNGVIYVLETGRFLYPRTVEIYNAHLREEHIWA